jgi:uncharacterized protein (DUF2267 family)
VEDGIPSRSTRAAYRPRDEAEALTHATLQVLGERLSAGESEDLGTQFPSGDRNDDPDTRCPTQPIVTL